MVHRTYLVLAEAGAATPPAGSDGATRIVPVDAASVELKHTPYGFDGVLARRTPPKRIYDDAIQRVVHDVIRDYQGGCVLLCGEGRAEADRLEQFLGSSHGGLGYAGWAVEDAMRANPSATVTFALGCLKDNDKAVNLLKNLAAPQGADDYDGAARAARAGDAIRPFNLFPGEDPFVAARDVNDFRTMVNRVRKSPSFARVSASLTLSVTIAIVDPVTRQETTLVLLDVTPKHFKDHGVLPMLCRMRMEDAGAGVVAARGASWSPHRTRVPDLLKVPLQRSAVVVTVAHQPERIPTGAVSAAAETLEQLSALSAMGGGPPADAASTLPARTSTVPLTSSLAPHSAATPGAAPSSVYTPMTTGLTASEYAGSTGGGGTFGRHHPHTPASMLSSTATAAHGTTVHSPARRGYESTSVAAAPATANGVGGAGAGHASARRYHDGGVMLSPPGGDGRAASPHYGAPGAGAGTPPRHTGGGYPVTAEPATPYGQALQHRGPGEAAQAPDSILKLRQNLTAMEHEQQMTEMRMKLSAGEAAAANAAEVFRKEIVNLHARLREKDEELARWEGRQSGMSNDRLDFERTISELRERLVDAEEKARNAEATADAATKQAIDNAAQEGGGWETVAKLRRELSNVYEQLSNAKQKGADAEAQVESMQRAHKKELEHAQNQARQREDRLREDAERGVGQYRGKLIETERALQDAQSQLQRASDINDGRMAAAMEADAALKEQLHQKEAESERLKSSHKEMREQVEDLEAELAALKETLRQEQEAGARHANEVEHRMQMQMQEAAHEHEAQQRAQAAAHQRELADAEARRAQQDRAMAAAEEEHAKDVQHRRDTVASQNVLLEEKEREVARLKDEMRGRRDQETERLQGQNDQLQDAMRAAEERAALQKALRDLELEEAEERLVVERRGWALQGGILLEELRGRAEVEARKEEAALEARWTDAEEGRRGAVERAERERRQVEQEKREALREVEEDKREALKRRDEEHRQEVEQLRESKRDAVERAEAEKQQLDRQAKEEKRALREQLERERELREQERLQTIETRAAREGEVSTEISSLKSQLAVAHADALKYSRMCEARELELKGLQHLGAETEEVRTRNAELERLLRDSSSYGRQQQLTRELEVAKDALEGVRQRVVPSWCPEWRRLNRMQDLKVQLITAVEHLDQTYRRLESDERTLRARESAAVNENEGVSMKLNDYARRSAQLEVALTQAREEVHNLRGVLDIAKSTISTVAGVVVQTNSKAAAATSPYGRHDMQAPTHPFGETWTPCSEVDVWLTSSVRQIAIEADQYRASDLSKTEQIAELKDMCARLQAEVDRVNVEVRDMTHQMLGLGGGGGGAGGAIAGGHNATGLNSAPPPPSPDQPSPTPPQYGRGLGGGVTSAVPPPPTVTTATSALHYPSRDTPGAHALLGTPRAGAGSHSLTHTPTYGGAASIGRMMASGRRDAPKQPIDETGYGPMSPSRHDVPVNRGAPAPAPTPHRHYGGSSAPYASATQAPTPTPEVGASADQRRFMAPVPASVLAAAAGTGGDGAASTARAASGTGGGGGHIISPPSDPRGALGGAGAGGGSLARAPYGGYAPPSPAKSMASAMR